MHGDPLADLRAALDRPDRRGWRRHLVPAARGEADGDAGTVVPEPARRPWATMLAVAVTGALGVTLMAALRPVPDSAPGADARAEGRPVAAASSTTPVAPSTSTPAAERLWPAEPVEVRGREVQAAGQRWEVGQEGDIVVIGDWDCDRRRTPAVLRPATGSVAVFDEWDGGVARPVATVEGATRLTAGSSCGQAEVATPDGPARLIDTRGNAR